MNYYLTLIDAHDNIGWLVDVMREAADDMKITDDEYAYLYDYATEKARRIMK